ncbi:MAG: phosphatase PAP2 family protein [Bdellovibrionota bacterium]
MLLVGNFFFLGYIGIPRLVDGREGISLAFSFERAIPYQSWAAVPYILGYPVVLLPGFLFPETHYFRRGTLALLSAMGVSFIFFLVLPIRCIPPPAQELIDAFFLDRLFWLDDGGWNAFPSLHVAVATAACLSLLRISFSWTVFGMILWLSIFASTLLLKRHYFLDSAAGAALGCAVHFLFVEPEFRRRGVPWVFS